VAKDTFIALNISGWQDLEKGLRALGSDRAVRATMRRAILGAGEPIAADARSRVPVRSGGLRESIDVRPTLSPRQRADRGARPLGPNSAESFIGPSWPEGAHGVLVEFGTQNRSTKKGVNKGSTAAHPFMRPAWEAGKARALNEFGERLGHEIERSAARIGKQQKKAGP